MPPPLPANSHADAIRRGDAPAFEELFREHYAALCHFAVRYVESRALAEELVQDVFTQVWIDRARWPDPRNRRAYLFTAVRNRALNADRRRRLERDWIEVERAEGEASEPAVETDEPFRAGDSDARVRLERAVASLPERCRLVMHLRWQEGMAYADIAKVLGISAKGVENQLARGLRALRRQFGLAD